MRILRMEAHRRISNIIAAKSMNRKFIGTVAGWMGSIPVGRAMDLVKPGNGKIYMPDPTKEPLLVKGVGTNFEQDAQKGGLLVLPTVNSVTASTEIEEIVGPEELKLKKAFKSDSYVQQLTGKGGSSDPERGFEGSNYKLAPKVDQTQVYDAVFHRLQRGGAICIFPEGGSNDRTELLPLKGRTTLGLWE
jgi:glycerol-3-phosphate O-acyltransferase/dihydroxyacetone phosphate acyltransferase